jgi:hypothetical protein
MVIMQVGTCDISISEPRLTSDVGEGKKEGPSLNPLTTSLSWNWYVQPQFNTTVIEILHGDPICGTSNVCSQGWGA